MRGTPVELAQRGEGLREIVKHPVKGFAQSPEFRHSFFIQPAVGQVLRLNLCRLIRELSQRPQRIAADPDK